MCLTGDHAQDPEEGGSGVVLSNTTEQEQHRQDGQPPLAGVLEDGRSPAAEGAGASRSKIGGGAQEDAQLVTRARAGRRRAQAPRPPLPRPARQPPVNSGRLSCPIGGGSARRRRRKPPRPSARARSHRDAASLYMCSPQFVARIAAPRRSSGESSSLNSAKRRIKREAPERRGSLLTAVGASAPIALGMFPTFPELRAPLGSVEENPHSIRSSATGRQCNRAS